jgi:hypothetical protein
MDLAAESISCQYHVIKTSFKWFRVYKSAAEKVKILVPAQLSIGNANHTILWYLYPHGQLARDQTLEGQASDKLKVAMLICHCLRAQIHKLPQHYKN